MLDEARVTVVIPAWGDYAGQTLVEAVQSVDTQSEPARVVVVDNASSVALPALPQAHVIRTPERVSVGASRNFGLGAVETPWVMFLDADDLLLPGALARLVALAEQYPSDVAWVGGILDGETGQRHRSPRQVAAFLSRWPQLFAIANAVWPQLPLQGATLLRTEVVREIGGYDDSSRGGDDAPMCVQLAFRGRARFTREPALLYRWRSVSPGNEGFPDDLVRRNLERVRERMRKDPKVAFWLVPVVAAGQTVFLRVVRPVALRARHARSRLKRLAGR